LIEGSERFHGGKLRPTPQGVPLVWTVSTYDTADLIKSGTQQDIEMANQLKREGGTHWTHHLCRQVS